MKNNVLVIIGVVLLCFIIACKKDVKTKPIKTVALETPKLQAVYINGDSIHYTDFGTGEPVIFVHGSLGDYTSWGAQVDTFATQHRVIAYSRRYAQPNRQVFNDSADYSVVPHAKDLAALIKALNLEPVHLVGHSWGAYTALKTTLDHPELVKSLVLGEPPVHSLIRNTRFGDSILNALEENTFKPSVEAFKENNNTQGISLFLGGVMADSLFYSKAPDYIHKHWNDNVLELRGLLINRSWITITPDEVKRIRTPVLVIKGEVSPLFLREVAVKLDSLLPNSQLFTLPKSSHGLQSSNPKVFNKTVLSFIDSH